VVRLLPSGHPQRRRGGMTQEKSSFPCGNGEVVGLSVFNKHVTSKSRSEELGPSAQSIRSRRTEADEGGKLVFWRESPY